MSLVVKRLVSKKKRRIKEKVNKKTYELDLSYITDDLIAMGFPCSGFQSFYRNSYSKVKGYLDGKHKGHYKLWNLCREREYPITKFEDRVSHEYRFFDHEAPPWDMLIPCCKSIDEYLNESEENIAAIHCKAGKGRTGVIICAYLLYSGRCKTVDEAFDLYANARTKNHKGVTIPSQRRYIRYLGTFINNNNQVPSPDQQLRLRLIRFNTPLAKEFKLTFEVQDKDRHTIYNHQKDGGEDYVVTKLSDDQTEIPCDVLIHDDVKIIVQFQKGNKEKELFHAWINSQFVVYGQVIIPKFECDKTHKDKKHEKFSKDWQLQLVFHDKNGRAFPPPPTDTTHLSEAPQTTPPPTIPNGTLKLVEEEEES